MHPQGILETVLYAPNLDRCVDFYRRAIGLTPFATEANRHVFFRCGDAVFLLFNPDTTSMVQTTVAGAPIPLHGARGAGHVAFRIAAAELPAWRAHLIANGVAIETEVHWPGGGQSIYVRDPAGNSVELATAAVWGLS
jgi:catechol 2,3-dioxygenase-like lactoylglutathione lyase family enzyme